ncbi:MAG: DUF4386 domain-containing protein [Proteobacteria bacterium]|nr:DUF4386 domain-containing protein [Pseudomonadota bacterium]
MKWVTNPGRVAGFLYLLLVVAAPIRLIYIPNALFVHDDAAATAANIVAHETLFRFGMVSDMFCAAIEVFLVAALYWLFKGIDKRQAVLMVILGAMPNLGMYLFNVANDAAALMLTQGGNFLSAFDKPQRDAMAMLFLHLHGQVITAAEIFWGLWLFPLGMLVFRSRFVPRFLGIWLILNGIAYVAESAIGLTVPHYADALSKILFPVQFGEVAFMLWLLIMGVGEPERPLAKRPDAGGAPA